MSRVALAYHLYLAAMGTFLVAQSITYKRGTNLVYWAPLDAKSWMFGYHYHTA